MKKKPVAYSSPALTQLLTTAPGVHLSGTVTWSLGEEVLAFLDEHVVEGSSTLETGAGISTLLFAFKRAAHTSITPSVDEVERLKAHCQQHRVPTEGVTFVVEPSQRALPSLPQNPLDLVLIDGSHAFPLPFIDWTYTAPRLKIGGLLIVDDTQLWTGEVLSEFLRVERAWKLEKEFSRSCVFRKVSDDLMQEWTGQAYVLDRSYIWRRGRWRKARSVLRPPGPLGALLRRLRGR